MARMTEFGMFTWQYRMAHNLILRDMARALKVTSAYLSSLEVGTRFMSEEIEKFIMDGMQAAFPLTKGEVTDLAVAMQDTRFNQKINGLFKSDPTIVTFTD